MEWSNANESINANEPVDSNELSRYSEQRYDASIHSVAVNATESCHPTCKPFLTRVR